MIVVYASEFYLFYKKRDVRIRRQFDKALELFEKNPLNASLDNHALRDPWKGYRSIHIGDPKNDYCAIYEEIHEGNETIARFVALGTHKELFGHKR